MATDIRLSSLLLTPNGIPRPLQLGGADVAASFSRDPSVSVADGINGPRFGKMRTPKGVIMINCFEEDLIHQALRDIHNIQEIPGFFMGGSLTTSLGDFVSWTESFITQMADIIAEESPTERTWEITVGRNVSGKVPA